MTVLDDRPARSGDGSDPRATGAAAANGERPSRRGAWRRRARRPLPARLRRRRRRLLLASAPVVVLLLLAAVRLVSLNLVAAQTIDGYAAGDKPRTLAWGERQGWVNVVEPFRSPFAIGDAHVLSGHFELARPWFEQAFEQVPKGGLDDCKVRVNLGLTYEALGDQAKARERTDEWKQFYDKGIAITSERPPLCEAPEGGQTGEQLESAQQRMEEKSSGAEPDQPPQPQEQQDQPAPDQPTQPAPAPGRTPSQEEQDYLKEQQRRNTIERNQQQGQDDTSPGDGGPTYPKPW